MLVNGWPLGNGGSVTTVGSMRLASSLIDGSRQPLRAPTAFSMQCKSASLQIRGVLSGDLSHTRPVSRSSTASLFMLERTMNRVFAGSVWCRGVKQRGTRPHTCCRATSTCASLAATARQEGKAHPWRHQRLVVHTAVKYSLPTVGRSLVLITISPSLAARSRSPHSIRRWHGRMRTCRYVRY